MRTKLKILFSLLLAFIIILGFTVPLNLSNGWYQQFMPNLGGRQINDITFTDSLNGYAVTSMLTTTDTAFIVKTTNSGDNWTIKYRAPSNIFKRIMFINSTTGFVGGTNFIKTTNAGESWITKSSYLFMESMFVLNNDTAWYVDPNSAVGGVFRTNNGGINWIPQGSFGSNNPSHIYMYNQRIGFIDAGSLRRTTDGGTTWTPIIGAGNFLDMFFIDSLTGWKCNLDMKKTTDGGLNWTAQILPSGGMIVTTEAFKLSVINRDTLWAAGGWMQYPNFQSRGILYRTTNGGNTWLFQSPDSSVHIFEYFYIKFTKKNTGWAYNPATGIHTISGGDPIFYTGVKQVVANTPKYYTLYQNYPNPFNPRTIIVYEMKSRANIQLMVYDITGKIVSVLVDDEQSAGIHKEEFSADNQSSGVYFYSLIINGNIIDTKKLIYLK